MQSNSTNLYQDYLEKLNAVLSVRYESDMKYDVDQLLYISGRLIRENDGNIDWLLLTLPFISIDCFAQLSRRILGPSLHLNLKKEIIHSLTLQKMTLVCIFVSNRDIFSYQIDYNGKEIFNKINIDKDSFYREWERVSEFEIILQYPEDEYERQLRILKEIGFKLCYKDAQLSSKPSLYILGPHIAKIPSNILYMCAQSAEPLNHNSSELLSIDVDVFENITIDCVEAWMPSETGDYAINIVRSKTEDKLLEHDISLTLSETFKLSSEAAICVAHGNEKTFWSKELFCKSSGSVSFNPVGPFKGAKFVVLLACYSGKGGPEIVGNSISSMVKMLSELGVEAVIAPKWALHVDIAAAWLNSFLDNFMKGQNSFAAYSNAIADIMKVNPHPGAWGCIHYFGKRDIVLKK